jgi:hypothetical protein
VSPARATFLTVAWFLGLLVGLPLLLAIIVLPGGLGIGHLIGIMALVFLGLAVLGF